MSLSSIEGILISIDDNVNELLHKLFPIPTSLTLHVQGADMGAPVTAKIGQTVTFVTTESDTTTTPPTPFPIIPANLVYTQDTVISGTLVVNPDGTAHIVTTAAGTVTVTVTDSLSNPGTTLTDSVVVTVTALVKPTAISLTATVT